MREHICPPDHAHERRQTCYRTHRCGCIPCRTAESRRKNAERARARSGTHRGMVPKTATVEHLQRLHAAGVTNRDIFRCSGLDVATIRRLLTGKGAHVFPQTERAVLAVKVNGFTARPPKAWVSPIGSVRRIQALLALGWTGVEIAERAGRPKEWAMRILHFERIEEASRRQVEAVYDELSMTVPSGRYANHTRRWAAAKGWMPPLAWDDDTIDDPAATPQLKQRHTARGMDELAVHVAVNGGSVHLIPEERREVVRILHARRWSDARIAARADCDPRTVFRIRDELGLPGWDMNEQQEAAA